MGARPPGPLMSPRSSWLQWVRGFAQHLPRGLRKRALGPGELADRARRGDGAVLRIGLVVLFDVAEVVEIVHHQPVRLAAPAFGEIARPVEPFEAGAVAEMEAGDRIERGAGG